MALLERDDQSTMTNTGSDSVMFGSYSSGWSSAFGSEIGSTETESEDEEDGGEFMAELTRQMADYMLDEDDENAETKSLGPDCELGPTELHGQELQSPTGPAYGFQGFSDDQSRPVHLYKLENQPVAKHQDSVSWGRRVPRTELTRHQKPRYTQNTARRADALNGGGFGPPPTGWPPLQQRRPQQKPRVGSGSGMRAVFLGGPGSTSGSSGGTGVFLPRGTTPVEVRKKTECSTVLIPARVLQTLQLHFKEMNSRVQSNSPSDLTSHPQQYDVAPSRNSDTNSHQEPHLQHAGNHQEVGLPQEWTY